MLFWKYLREFLIFRWLFGSHSHEETSHRASSHRASSDDDRYVDSDCDYDYSCDYDHSPHNGHSHSYYDPLEDPENLDDYTSRYGGQDYYDSMYGGSNDYGSSYGGYDDYSDDGFDDFDSGDDW